MTENKVRVRFAPSPTGPLHIGGLRTALFNYLFSKQQGGVFILRIEDTDQNRYVKGAEQYILNSFEWCGLLPDEGQGVGGDYGPYRQSERKEIYRQYAEQLIENGNAYYAFDTPAELEEMRKRLQAEKASNQQYGITTRDGMKNSLSLSEEEVRSKITAGEPYVIRIKTPHEEEVKFNDIIRGEVAVQTSSMDDKVLLKADGMPTYHLANVVDDYLMKITHVIRGEEWLPSAPLHVLLYRYLGWEAEMPAFAHLPLLLKPEGNGKLSKRDGDRLGFPVFPLEWTDPETAEKSTGYKEEGYFPDAFLNMLAFLGWNPGTEKEIFSIEELAKEFSLDKITKAGAKFDIEKANWYNQQYLMAKTNEQLADLLQPNLSKSGVNVSEEYLESVCGLMKERSVFTQDIYNNGKYFFEAPTSYDEKTVKKKWKDESPQIINELIAVFSEIEPFNPDISETVFKAYVEEKELGFGTALISLRLAITGEGGGPSMFDIIALLGKEEIINRMKTGMEKIPALKEMQS